MAVIEGISGNPRLQSEQSLNREKGYACGKECVLHVDMHEPARETFGGHTVCA